MTIPDPPNNQTKQEFKPEYLVTAILGGISAY